MMSARAGFLAAVLLAAYLAAPAAAAGRDLAATANPCAGKKDGSLVPVSGCSANYNQCWRQKPVKPAQKCQAPLVFNPAADPPGCSYVGAVGTTGCNCQAAYKGDANTQAACTVCQAQNTAGNFAFPGNPRMYVQCSTQGVFPMRCNGNLRWNQKKQNCA